MDNLKIQKFSDININDPFFDSLKENYKEFTLWFNKKSDKNALVLYNEHTNTIEGFLFCKFESGPGNDIEPPLPDSNHMKVGTFKFNPQGTRRGDRYLKKIFDYALADQSNPQNIYVTVFSDKHSYLVQLFSKYGFESYGQKTSENGVEQVLLRDLNKVHNDVNKDYPMIHYGNNRKYLLSIYPEYHTRLFPDSILVNESPNIVKDISHSNSIHKIYICRMEMVTQLQRGDVLVIYRTGDGQGPAEYRAVATSLCVVEDVHTLNSYRDENHFVNECIKFSVFSEQELRDIYRDRKTYYVINFTYNAALPKRIIRQDLANQVGLDRDERWGCIPLSDQQFNKVIQLSNVPSNILVP